MTGMPNSERFWRHTASTTRAAERDPWFRAKRGSLGVETDQNDRAPRWRPRYRHPPRPRRAGAITVDPRLSQEVGRLMGAIAPELQKAYDDHLAPLAGEVWAFVPQQSRLLKASVALEYGVQNGGRTFWGAIHVRAPYALVVKGGPVRNLLIQKERDVIDRIAAQALNDLARD